MSERWIVWDVDPGRPVVGGTDAPVDEILDALASGAAMDAVMAAFPGLDQDGIAAALRYGARTSRAGPAPYAPVEVPALRIGEQPAVYGAVPAERAAEAVDDAEYEDLKYRLAFAEEVSRGLSDVIAGRTMGHDDAVAWLRERIPG